MEFPAGIQTDRVDDEVGMDMLSVSVGADKNFMALIVLCQLECGGMSRGRGDLLTLWEALNHVEEQNAVRLMVEFFRGHEIFISFPCVTVDAGDELRVIPYGFLVLHGVSHYGFHAAARLTAAVVDKADDRHGHHRFRFRMARSAPRSSEKLSSGRSRSRTRIFPMWAKVTS